MTIKILIILFFFALFLEYFVFDGYLRLLQLIVAIKFVFKKPISLKSVIIENEFPTISVLTTVYNEENRIQKKIEDILKQDYPKERMEVVIASDGSTDNTDEIVKSFHNPRIRLIRNEGRKGKSQTQNYALSMINSQIVITTDTETSFEPGFLTAIVEPFSDPKVGGVDGHLLFKVDEHSSISNSQGFYWNFEIKLRTLESQIGILAVASGACMAIRRNLIRPIEQEYGEDCVVPLDVVLQGYVMVHASTAIAFDKMEYDSLSQFKSRVRMTQRNIQGTFSRKLLLNPFRSFGYAMALWFHKILRWFSPVFLIIITMSSLLLMHRFIIFRLVSIVIGFLYLGGLLGWLAEHKRWQIPIIKTIFSFLLANLGFLVGLIRAFKGKKITNYR